ncbi:MAG: class I SAM-dependent methyltransferase [Candidatus Gastranaerophilales bacterium]|nr:class I SAM-dependent methyltransferase [Candidatus Gastranaerophilales bacterium]
MNTAKTLFEEEAREFDYIIPLLIPFYNEIYDILIASIPFEKNSAIKILDIGAGTGTLAKKLKQNFPFSKITCLDFSNNMTEIAKAKLIEYQNDIEFKVDDFNTSKFEQKYDVIVSSFALHHIPTDKEKVRTYNNIYKSLNPEGIFLTADIVLGTGEHMKNLYFEKWRDFMHSNFSEKTVVNELMPKYQAGDNPAPLIKHLNWLTNVGFNEVESIWKYFSFAVFGGKKTH